MDRIPFFLCLCCALLGVIFLNSKAEARSERTVILQGLDKVTARISTIEVPVGDEVVFGTLVINARTCSKRPPEEQPETTAFLEVIDDKPG